LHGEQLPVHDRAETMERISYHGWPDSIRMSNEQVDLVLLAEVGPRIIRLGFLDEENEFHIYEDTLGSTGGDAWRSYGGHRLWYAPEDPLRTYHPDNERVQAELQSDCVRLTQAIDPFGIRKEMSVWLSPNDAHVSVTHRLRNHAFDSIELAPWSLSVMAPGGTAVLPLPPRGKHPEHLRPTSTVSLWPYTDLTDPRWTLGRRYIMLRQDTEAASPQKIGAMVPDGWAAYARAGHLFVTVFSHFPDVRYPDLGCNAELWTDSDMLEVETLGPLRLLAPGETVEHIEHWFLFRGMPAVVEEADVGRHILPSIEQALRWVQP